MNNNYDMLRGMDHIINPDNAQKMDYEDIINGLVSNGVMENEHPTTNINKEVHDMLKNLNLTDLKINLDSEERPARKSQAPDISRFIKQNSATERNYEDEDDDEPTNISDTHLRHKTDEKRTLDHINNVIGDIERSKRSAHGTSGNFGATGNFGGTGATDGNFGGYGATGATNAPGGGYGATGTPGSQSNYVHDSEIKKERDDCLDTLYQCKKYLKEWGSPTLDDLPPFSAEDDLEKLLILVPIYKRAKSNQQYNAFSNEIITFISKGVENVLNGKRVIFGKRPDATGWTKSGANVKIRRLQSQIAHVIGKILEDNKIGLILTSTLELGFNLITYVNDKSSHAREPDIYGPKYDINTSLSQIRNFNT